MLLIHLIRALGLCLFLAFPSISLASAPTSAEYGVILNLSGKQRMLTQKMSKEALLVALEMDSTANVSQLANTIQLFDKTLAGLRDGSDELGLPPTTSRRILRQLDKVDVIWSALHPVFSDIVASGRADPNQIEVVARENGPLLKAMNKAVGLYEKEAKKGGLEAAPGLATTINLAGKQRMLTQKMSKEFLLIAYGSQSEDNKLNLLETSALFERTLTGLKSGDEVLGLPGTDVAPIRDQLQIVETLWNDFKPLIEHATAGAPVTDDQCTIVAETNVPLLKQMNKVVGMFEAEAT